MMLRHLLLPLGLSLLAAAPAAAQRTGENAVLQAEDAFGTSVGRESIGLYTASSVRGFSPTAAGNIRVDGLAFDQVWGFTSRIRQSTTIRVGIAAIGTPFPAPTGIVDYALRKPGDTTNLSVLTGGDGYGETYVELDAALPVSSTLSLGVGGALYNSRYYNGTTAFFHQQALLARWRPSADVDVLAFTNRSEGEDETGLLFVPAGPFLPPPVPRNRFEGPNWARYQGIAANSGLVATARPAAGWELKAGLFRSLFNDEQSFSHLLVDLQPDGTARRLVFADPPSRWISNSGEARVTRLITEGPRTHRLILSARGRDRSRSFDGSDEIDLGPTRIGAPAKSPQPAFSFSERTSDRVQQGTLGLAYGLVWQGRGELGVGLQKTDYRKSITQPGLATVSTAARPWLWNINAALVLAEGLALYGGYTRGLEESGVAPANAANRNEALPAILTSQRDVGLRYALSPDLSLVAGLFDVRKPYFNLDAANVFTELGDVKHQGVELSLAGKLTPHLNLVAGAVLLKARVTGEAVALGRVGERPVGQSDRELQLNLDWQMPFAPGLSTDLSVTHEGDVVATRDNLVSIPSRTLVDAGLRYRTRLGGKPVTFRLTLSNIGDVQGFDLRGAGAYDIIPGRTLGGWIAVDL